ncbi:hypothetical protein GGX14DRAFT_443798 [Mycena pura]|uniref:Mixed lineage kinase domain-containing protein n=1 Tax=Mycena pura TaxID=153505 RepID=A0AAD6VJ23_9AGAR|nr:hypothetical protein GGX14DRAFT_443798 [Mycena pura]
MPAIRHTRREGRLHNPIAPTSTVAPAGTSSSGTKGFSIDTTPLFLRRSKANYRVDELMQRGLDASRLLQSIGSSMNLEKLQIVASSCALLFETVASVRTNKTQCMQLLERVHQIVRAIINLCGDAKGLMAPMMTRAIEQFSTTLTQLHGLLRTQASFGLFARILRHAEIQDALTQCSEALQQALDVFTVQSSLITNSAMGGMRRSATDRHAEILRALGR